MSETRVTTGGQEGARPGAEATVGVNVPPGGGGPRRRRGRGEEPEFRSYYDLPVLNKVVWSTPDVAGYLFVGGITGGSGLVAAGAHATGRRRLRKVAKVTAAGGTYLSLAMLIHDMGRPARFLNMLRVVKVTSPMNVGSWLLTGFGLATTIAATAELTGKVRRVNVAATAVGAALGPAVSTYTAALLSDTAVPAWHDGYRLMPFVFANSAAASTAALALVVAPPEESAVLAPLAAASGVAEIALTKAMERQTGVVKETFEQGDAGRYLRAAEGLTAAGALLAATARRSRLRSALGGAALLAGSLCTRIGIFKAGIASTEDPKYTVVPQRERMES